MSEVKVNFRFVGEKVDPQHISELLAITPSKSAAKGEPVNMHPGRRYSTGSWMIESGIPDTNTLDEHIRNLLDILEAHRLSVQQLRAEGYDPNFFCSVFASRSNEYVRFDLGLLDRIASLGASIDLHIYSNPEIT